MNRAKLKLGRPINEIEIDLEENTLEAEGYIKVVWCKDCKYSRHWYLDKRVCELWAETGVDVFNDDFCSRGEKKDGEEKNGKL